MDHPCGLTFPRSITSPRKQTGEDGFTGRLQLVGDVPAATAILDRFLHHAEFINITGKSYRLKDRACKKGFQGVIMSGKKVAGFKPTGDTLSGVVCSYFARKIPSSFYCFGLGEVSSCQSELWFVSRPGRMRLRLWPGWTSGFSSSAAAGLSGPFTSPGRPFSLGTS